MPRIFTKNIVSETYKFFKFTKGKTKTQSRVLAAEARETGNYPNEVLKIMKRNSDQLATLKKVKKEKSQVVSATNQLKVAPKLDVPEGTQLELFNKLGWKKKKKKKVKYPAPPEGDSRGQKTAGLLDPIKDTLANGI